MKLICIYCKGECKRYNPGPMWYECKSCDVHFYENDDGFMGICIYKDIKDHRYRLEILPEKPKTFLFQLKPDFKLLVETKQAINVTPESALAKIKHLLMFL